MNKYIIFLSAIIPLNICSCAHLAQDVSQINGVIMNNGVPASGTAVRYEKTACGKGTSIDNSIINTIADVDGKFQIEGKKKIAVSLPVMADYAVCWKLCFDNTDGDSKCWKVEAFGPPEPPKLLELKCELTSEKVCKVEYSSYKNFHNLLDDRISVPNQSAPVNKPPPTGWSY